ncbi:hypothetical protein C1701_23975 [Actinoalloteichus sp. AHMU CJ021]|uniref:HAD-IIIC family phosphatase n=1 Tax=Actinoalloteichus sp. AHMU CJ021 TaxID=2072503 RepID=UPI000CA04AD1|nr:hypothetical protein C1701_23975 [Actinoalloteichus sp. AHMU CJ021]
MAEPVPGGGAAGDDALRMLVVSSFTATPVRTALEFWGRRLGVDVELAWGAYGQVFQELQLVRSGRCPEVVAVLVRWEDFLPAGDDEAAGVVAEELGAAVDAAARHAPDSAFLVVSCPPSPPALADPARARSLTVAEEVLFRRCPRAENVTHVGRDEVLDRYRVSRVDDGLTDELGHIPYTPEFFAALGTTLVRRWYLGRVVEPKVLVVDGDGTLWDGVLGEDGVSGVEVGPARREVHRFLVEQRRAGRLLCLCSKNDRRDVERAFTTVPGMVLRRDDFVRVRADWSPKSVTVAELAADLGLGLDTVVFVDDSRVECAEVRARHPEVRTVGLPPEAEGALRTLRHCWPLDIGRPTAEGSRRTEWYRQDDRRRELRDRSATSLADFLDRLGLEVTIRPPGPADLPRILELTRRTTQFTLSGRRWGAAELTACPTGGRVVDVRDRFGGYGTVGLMLFSTEGTVLSVTGFLLSCRALGRGVEHRMLAHLGEVALARGLDEVRLSFADTPRNLPARRFLSEVAVPHPDTGCSGYVLGASAAAHVRFDPDGAPPTGAPLAPPGPKPAPEARPPVGLPWFWDDPGDMPPGLTTADGIREALGAELWADTVPADTVPDDERAVVRIWTEILQLPPDGIDGNFRALGGGSLEFVQLVARVYDEFGVELPVDPLLDDPPTVADLLSMIRRPDTAGAVLSDEEGVPWIE